MLSRGIWAKNSCVTLNTTIYNFAWFKFTLSHPISDDTAGETSLTARVERSLESSTHLITSECELINLRRAKPDGVPCSSIGYASLHSNLVIMMIYSPPSLTITMSASALLTRLIIAQQAARSVLQIVLIIQISKGEADRHYINCLRRLVLAILTS